MTSLIVVFALFLQAHEAPPAAEAAYKRGKLLYKKADKKDEPARFAECAAEFEKAYKISPQARFSYNAAQCHRRAGAAAAAVDWFKRYLQDDPSARDRSKVEARIEEIEHELAALAPPPASRPKAEAKTVDLRPAPSPPMAPLPLFPAQKEERPAVYKRWWFWTLAAGIAGGATLGILAASRSSTKSAPSSQLGTFEPAFR